MISYAISVKKKEKKGRKKKNINSYVAEWLCEVAVNILSEDIII